MVADTPAFGRGIYPINEAARILGVPTNRVKRWLDPESGVVVRYYAPSEATISFLELMELLFIKMFRHEGVTLQTIRKAAHAASQCFETDYPFAVKRFDTDGKTVFATLVQEATDVELVKDLRRGQYVFQQIVRPFFRNLEYGEQEVMRYWPLTRKGRVVLDPNRRMGQPIDATTGVPTSALYKAFLANPDQDAFRVAKWFDVPVKAVAQATRFEESLL